MNNKLIRYACLSILVLTLPVFSAYAQQPGGDETVAESPAQSSKATTGEKGEIIAEKGQKYVKEGKEYLKIRVEDEMRGVLTAMPGGIIEVGGRSEIINQGNKDAAGIRSFSLGDGSEAGYIKVGEFSEISSLGKKKGENSHAVQAGYYKDGTGQAGKVEMGAEQTIWTQGDKSAAVYAAYKSEIIVGNSSSISTSNANSPAVRAGHMSEAQGGGTITIGNNARISTSSWAPHAVDAQHEGSLITVGKDSEVKTERVLTHAVYARDGGEVQLREEAKIQTKNGGSYALHASGASEGKASRITIREKAEISTVWKSAHAVYALNGGEIDMQGAKIKVDPTKGALAVKAETNIDGKKTSAVRGDGIFKIRGDLLSRVGLAEKEDIDDVSGATLILDKSQIVQREPGETGSVDGKSKIDLTLRDGSTFTGATLLEGEGSELHLTMTGSETEIVSRRASELPEPPVKWKVTGDSQLTSLNLRDNSEVDFSGKKEFTTMTTRELNADGESGGLFVMKSDIAKKESDKLVITGEAGGSHQIRVINKGGEEAAGDERLALVEVGNRAKKENFALTEEVELGAWKYNLRSTDTEQGAAWELYGPKAAPADVITEPIKPEPKPEEPKPEEPKPEEPKPEEPKPDPVVVSVDETITEQPNEDKVGSGSGGGTGASNSGSAAVNTFYAAYLLNYAETQTLMQRLGDLRETPLLSGFWFRVHGGKFESNSKSYVNNFDMDYGGVQIGYDRQLENNWNGKLYTGVMFGYSKGDLDYLKNGDGTVNSKTLGVYGTFIKENGFYADAVLKYQWMKNDFKTLDSAGDRVIGGDVTSGGFGASLEVGRRFHFDEETKKGWYVEPQAQLSYQHQDGGYFMASNGLHIGVDGFTSLRGRIGLLAGYETGKTNFYAKVSRVKEFDGDITIVANGQAIDESFGSNWWVYGIGLTSRINDRNNLYFDLERSSGGSFTQDWAVRAGWRIVF